MNHWLVKTEPSAYAWETLVKDGRTAWTGVRNFAARNFLRSMQPGDRVFVYHSGPDKQIVGIAKVASKPSPDPTADEGDWVCVDLAPLKPLKVRVSLETIRSDAILKEMPLIRQSRLSVMPVAAEQAKRILELAS
ncbi:MAG: EVE domain-containing protein [Verrucomicrobiota bacterium]